jgi:hypothetical protein
MATRKSLDLRPGAIPDIRPDGDGITYLLEIAGTQGGGRLVIRCDPDGAIWVSIPRTPRSAGVDTDD